MANTTRNAAPAVDARDGLAERLFRGLGKGGILFEDIAHTGAATGGLLIG